MFPNVGPMEMLVLAVIALLLFGDRLPEVMRSVGKSLVEFKKGMQGIEGAIESAANSSTRRSQAAERDTEERDNSGGGEEMTAPRFEPPATEPRAVSESADPSAGAAVHPEPGQPA